MREYTIGVMSNSVKLKANNIDEAQCIGILYFNTNAPIAVYDCDEKTTLSFPYNIEQVDKVLSSMGERLKESYKSIIKVQ